MPKLSFWQKAVEVTNSIGNIALAGAGMAVAAVGGTLLTGLGYIGDGSPLVGVLELAIGAAAAGLTALVGDALGHGAAGTAHQVANKCIKLIPKFAMASMMFGANPKPIELGSTVWEGTKAMLRKKKDIIFAEVHNLRIGPTLAVASRTDYFSQNAIPSSDSKPMGGL